MPPGSAGTPSSKRTGSVSRGVDHQQHQVAAAGVEPLGRQVHLLGRGEVHEAGRLQRRRPTAPSDSAVRQSAGSMRCTKTSGATLRSCLHGEDDRSRIAREFRASPRRRPRESPLYAELAAAVADDDGDPRLPGGPAAASSSRCCCSARSPSLGGPGGSGGVARRDPGGRRPDPRDDAQPRSPRPTSRPAARRWSPRSATSRARSASSRRVPRPGCASIPTATATSSTAARSGRAAPSTW